MNKTEINFKGVKGEEYIPIWAKSNGYTFLKCEYGSEDFYKGVDYFINDIPCDVKNTDYIFWGRYDTLKNKFYVRHPFKYDCKAQNYIWMKDSKDKTEVVYYGPIKDYLINNYFIDNVALSEFKRVINTYDNMCYKERGLRSIDEFNIKLCKFLKQYLKENVLIDYPLERNLFRFKNKPNSNEICLKLIKREDRLRRIQNKNSI